MQVRGSQGKPVKWRSVAIGSVLLLSAAGCINLASGATGGGGSTTTGFTKIFVQKFRYHGMPATMKAGLHQLLFQNRESFSITHEMIPVALPAGKTAQDLINDTKAKGPDAEDDWLHIGGDFGAADTGAGVLETLYLPPGHYAIACWQTGTSTGGDGPPHAAIGMVYAFTVTG